MFHLNRSHLTRFQSLLALSAMVVALSLSTDSFLTVDNGLNVLRQISINLCLSIGMTMIVITGGIDLSVGSVLALSGAIAAGLLKNGITMSSWNVVLQFTVLGAIAAGLVTGLAMGWFNGLMITRFRLPPFVATLGTLSIARGLTMLWTGGFPITSLGDGFRFLRHRVLAGHPGAGVGFGGAGGAVSRFHAADGFRKIHVRNWRQRANGAALRRECGRNQMAGLHFGRRIGRSCRTLDGGTTRLGHSQRRLQLRAGLDRRRRDRRYVPLGRTRLNLGTVLGCLIIGVLNNGLVLLEVSPFWQQVVKGVVILVAVAVDRASRREEE